MTDILNYIDSEKSRYLTELKEFLSIPSISSDPDYVDEVKRAANWVKDQLISIGINDVKLIETAGHPIVFGQWMEAGNDAPTILIYGHYDVQPVDPVELWKSDPFKPEVRDNKLFGRGTSDDKGQLFVHIKAVEAFLKNYGKLPLNVKFLIEGEEEAGSSNLDDFIENNADLLKCDTVLISDTEWFSESYPTICYSLRGISFIEVKLTGPNRDLHSGTYGGAVDNPINALSWIVSQLKDRYGRISIPGFYDDVLDLTKEERESFSKLPYNEDDYKDDLGIQEVYGETGYTTIERAWARPTLDLNGIKGGYIGEGAKTVLPSEASCKISMRLVPNQKADDITKKAVEYIKELTPPTMKVEVKELHGGDPVLVPRDSKGVKAAMDALKEAFGKDVGYMREGGSIPIVNVFSQILNAPVVLMGLGLPSDNIHSPNESFSVNNFYGGIKAAALFLDKMK